MHSDSSPNYFTVAVLSALLIVAVVILDNLFLKINRVEYSRILRRLSAIAFALVATYLSLTYIELVSQTYDLDIPGLSETLEYVRNLR
ncbi:hypothetical protein LIS04_140 [Listeria phage LIS04]|nr:hypothetical protein LIS04_140 [Listeria phage LIS04]